MKQTHSLTLPISPALIQGLPAELLAELGYAGLEEARWAQMEIDKKRKQEEEDKRIAEVARGGGAGG